MILLTLATKIIMLRLLVLCGYMVTGLKLFDRTKGRCDVVGGGVKVSTASVVSVIIRTSVAAKVDVRDCINDNTHPEERGINVIDVVWVPVGRLEVSDGANFVVTGNDDKVDTVSGASVIVQASVSVKVSVDDLINACQEEPGIKIVVVMWVFFRRS